MNSYNDVPQRMEYIQKLFVEVGVKLEKIASLNEVIALLENESPEFRSVAYESASFEIAMEDVKTNQNLERWKKFRQACATQHAFHIDIGLGWAFAKTGLAPGPYLLPMQALVKSMVFDGVGYYYGLFKGRSTLKRKTTPEFEGESLHGFDQGLGRRLWYIARGNVNEVVDLIESFPGLRHPDLFRGIGIACGYVGGSNENDLKLLLKISGDNYKQLQIGIILAAISRIASNTINADINLACRIVCNKNVDELRMYMISTTTNLFYLYNNGVSNSPWLTQLESELLQTN